MPKNNFIFLFFIALSLPVLFLSNSAGIAGKSTTGCGGNGCHQSSSNTTMDVTGIPLSGFKHDSIYTMTLSVSNSTKFKAGFDLTVDRGELTAGSGGNLNGTKELIHNVPKDILAGNVTWNFQWKAPAFGDSSVVFFVAANAVDANTHPSNDEFDTNNFLFNAIPAVTSVHEIGIPKLHCYPNPVQTMLYCSLDPSDSFSNFYIFDCMGKLLAIQAKKIDQTRCMFDLQALPKGNYILILNGQQIHRVGYFTKH